MPLAGIEGTAAGSATGCRSSGNNCWWPATPVAVALAVALGFFFLLASTSSIHFWSKPHWSTRTCTKSSVNSVSAFSSLIWVWKAGPAVDTNCRWRTKSFVFNSLYCAPTHCKLAIVTVGLWRVTSHRTRINPLSVSDERQVALSSPSHASMACARRTWHQGSCMNMTWKYIQYKHITNEYYAMDSATTQIDMLINCNISLWIYKIAWIFKPGHRLTLTRELALCLRVRWCDQSVSVTDTDYLPLQ